MNAPGLFLFIIYSILEICVPFLYYNLTEPVKEEGRHIAFFGKLMDEKLISPLLSKTDIGRF